MSPVSLTRQYTWTNNRLWRKNRREGIVCDGVDLNRNYDDHWGGVSVTLFSCSHIVDSCFTSHWMHGGWPCRQGALGLSALISTAGHRPLLNQRLRTHRNTSSEECVYDTVDSL